MIKPAFAALVAVSLLAGCANQRFNVASTLPANPAAKSEESQTFFIGGIGQQASVDAAKACGGAAKVSGVAVEQAPVDVLFSIVTLGVYTPRTARVYCN